MPKKAKYALKYAGIMGLSLQSVVDVPDFFTRFRRFRGGVIKMNPSHQTIHVTVHAGPHARRSIAGRAFPSANTKI